MRNLILKLIVLGILVSHVSCKSTNKLSINTIAPAQVDLSASINKIGIINSSLPIERAEYKDRLKEILATEDQDLTQIGTDAAIKGLFQELTKDPRFEKIILLDDVPEVIVGYNSTSGNHSWNSIERLCDKYQVDAIFSLAYFDTKTELSLKKTKLEQRDLMRTMVTLKGHKITLETLIENGWRIYDPQNREVIDEFEFSNQVVAIASDTSPIRALRSITDRKDSVLQKSAISGSDYGSRLQPSKEVVYREYYLSGSENLENAAISIQNENYTVAMKLWKKDAERSSPRISARACHNIAVLQEYYGKLEEADKWAKLSYVNSKSKKTKAYLAILEQRIAQKETISEQLRYRPLMTR